MTPLKLLQKNIDFVVLGTVLAIPGVVLVPLVLAYFLIIAPDNGDTNNDAENAPTVPVSDYAAAIATVNAAPVRTQAPPSTTGDDAVAVAQAAGYTDDMIAAGQSNFLGVCSACHGTDAKGISGLGKDLINSEFVHGLTDQELLAFVIKGRDIWDPANTTGVQMPARGGNPGLTDNDILNIIAYIRVISGNPGAGAGTTAVADAGTTSNPTDATPVATYDPNLPSPSDQWTPPVLPGSSGDSGTDTTAPTSGGAAIYATYCGDPLNTVICDFLQNGLADGSLTEEVVTDLVTNGTSAFDNPYPVTIPQRGGMLMMSDQDVADFVSELKIKAGVVDEAPAATTGNGPAVYATYCGDPLNTPICEFLQNGLADGSLTEEVVTDLIVNGTSAFDNPYPVTIAQRGGMLMLSDADVADLVSELKVKAGVAEAPATDAAPTDTPPADTGDSTAAQGRDGATVYAAFCEADDTGKAICDYLVQEITAGNLTDDQLFELLTLGTPAFDNPYPVVIPQRGGTLILSDIEVTNLINTLKEKAGVEVGAAMQPPPFITAM